MFAFSCIVHFFCCFPLNTDFHILFVDLKASRSLLSLLKDGNIDDNISCKGVLVSPGNFEMDDMDSENIEDDLYQRGLEDKFWWECPEILPERMPSLPAKRKPPTLESSSRRAKGENSSVDIPTQNSVQRGLGSVSLPPAPTRRDTFRQRKPNTSRPPSMHVDDYVARERSVDTAGNSNAITISRAGSSSGRPPSIHVDEFMARQRERGQNASTIVVGEAVVQVKNPTPARDTEKLAGKPKQFKADPDDDLQGIDIVFDGEECEGPDDKLPFLQPDENLMQPAPVMVEQNSPHSIVEETESDANGSSQFSHMGTPVASNVDENAQSEFSSRISASRPEMSLIREPSISSDRKFVDQADETKKMASLKSAGISESGFVPAYNMPGSSGQNLIDPRVGPQGFYSKSSQQHTGHMHGGFSGRGVYEQKVMPNQPPLPLVPPPSVSPVIPHSSDSLSNQSSPFITHGTQSSGGPIRLMPPLPSAIPQYSNPYASLPPRTSTVQSFGYNQAGTGTTEQQQSGPAIDHQSGNLSVSGTGMTSYPPPTLMSSHNFSRPSSLPVPFYGNPSHQGGDKPQTMLSVPSIPQSLNSQSIPQLSSMQLSQLQRPMQPPQHVRPPIQISPPSEQGVSMQNPFQIPMHQMQMMQQTQVQPYYHPPQQQEISQVQQQPQHHAVQGQQGAGSSQQQDSGMSLHDYFKSPEAIQVCHLHPW